MEKLKLRLLLIDRFFHARKFKGELEILAAELERTDKSSALGTRKLIDTIEEWLNEMRNRTESMFRNQISLINSIDEAADNYVYTSEIKTDYQISSRKVVNSIHVA